MIEKKVLLVIIQLLIFCLLSIGQTLNPYSNLIDDYNNFIENKMNKDRIVGVSVALIFNDSIIWKKGFGYADKENNIPMTTSTNMAIGSVTKPFTALGIMQLHENMLLNINKPLIDYLPEFSIKSKQTDLNEIDIKSILIHASGIPNDNFLNAWSESESYTDEIKYLKNSYLAYPPYMANHYSNIGYCLLGHTISKISGLDYPRYLQQNIFSPLQMNNTGFLNYQNINNISKTYGSNSMPYPIKQFRQIPAGGLYSNVDDLSRFAIELIEIYHGKENGIVTPETLKEITQPQNSKVLIDNYNTGLGWYVFKNDSSIAFHHNGSLHVASAGLWIFPEKKMAAIFLVNTIGGMSLISEGCGRLLQESSISSLDIMRKNELITHNLANIQIDSLENYAGLYSNKRSVSRILIEDDQLVLLTNNQNVLLKPTDNNKFAAYKINPIDNSQIEQDFKYSIINFKNYLILFKETKGGKVVVGQYTPNQIFNDKWKQRIGKYELKGYKPQGYETFSKAELYITEDNLFQLKIWYKSGKYTYNMIVDSVDDLVFCGFGESGGETISFFEEGGETSFTLFGLTMRKVN